MFYKINKNKLIIVYDQILQSLLTFIITIFITNYYGLSSLGNYHIFFSFLLFSNLICNSFSYEGFMIFYDRYKQNFITYNFLIIVIINLIFFILILIYFFQLQKVNLDILVYFFLYSMSYNLKYLVKKIFILKNLNITFFISSTLYFLSSLFLLWLFIYIKIQDITNIFKYLIYGDLLFILFLLCKDKLIIRKLKFKYFLFFIKKFIKRNLKYLTAQLLGKSNIFIMPLLVVYYFDHETLGLLRLYISTFGFVFIVYQIFENIYPLKFSKYSKESFKLKKLFYNHLTLNFIFIILIIVILKFFLDDIFQILFGLNSLNYIFLFYGAAIIILIEFFHLFFSFLLRVRNYINQIILISFLHNFIFLLLVNIFFIYYGIIGYFIASICSCIFFINFYIIKSVNFFKF